MKTKIFLILSIVFFAFLNSCTKEKAENVGLVGKWQLTETFSGYANGGDFKWHRVAPEFSHTLQFSTDSKYFEQNGPQTGNRQCYGTYRLLTSDTVEINSSCQTIITKTKISELTNKVLILDYQVIEGRIRDKYVAVK